MICGVANETMFSQIFTLIINISNSKVINAAKQSFGTHNFTHDEMEAISPALGTLFDLIHSIYIYTTTKQKIKSSQIELDDKTNAYNKYIEYTKEEREKIAKLSADLESEMEKIKESSRERSFLEKEFIEKQSKLRNVAALMKNTDKIIDKWKHDSTQINDDMKLMIGNTIVYASYLVYGGMLTPSQKLNMMTFLSNEIEKCFISSTSDSFL